MIASEQIAVNLSHNPILDAKTKHVELDLFFVREKVIAKQLTVQHIPGLDQSTDQPCFLQDFYFLETSLR